MDEWDDEDIDFENRVIFDGSNLETRRRINSASDIPIQGPAGDNLQLYDENGYPIPRRSPVYLPNSYIDTLPILQDLSKVKALYSSPTRFTEDHYDAELDEFIECHVPDPDDPGVIPEVFPQFFSGNIGHSRAPGLIYPFVQEVKKLSNAVGIQIAVASEDEIDMDPPPQAVEGISSQFYNAATHRFRASASEYIVNKGLVTASLGGAYAQGKSAQRTFGKVKNVISVHQPRQWLESLILSDDLDVSMRAENQYRINLFCLKPEHRNGQHIFEHILAPLSQMWSHGQIFDAVKDSMIVLNKDVSFLFCLLICRIYISRVLLVYFPIGLSEYLSVDYISHMHSYRPNL